MFGRAPFSWPDRAAFLMSVALGEVVAFNHAVRPLRGKH